MIPLTPAFLIAAAGGYIGVREEGGNNRGQLVELFLRASDAKPGQPWCAAFVHYVGFWSHYDHVLHRSFWPLPRTASCWVLGEFARRHGILAREPQPGDVFLVFDPGRQRFAHTGIVVSVLASEQRPSGQLWYECRTIEGNTNEEGSREGNAVAQKHRRFYPDAGDRFVRWVELDRRNEPGDPRHEKGRAA
jgi:hypothetical protein